MQKSSPPKKHLPALQKKEPSVHETVHEIGKDIPIHPFALLYPEMTSDCFEALKEDIRKNGLHTPGVLYDGQILDGRCRYLACLEVDVAFRTVEYTGSNPFEVTVGNNMARHHLTTSQRALLAAEISIYSKAKAKENEIPHLTLDAAAQLFAVSTKSVKNAKKILDRKDESLIEKVRRGKNTISSVIEKYFNDKKDETSTKTKSAIEKKSGKGKISKKSSPKLDTDNYYHKFEYYFSTLPDDEAQNLANKICLFFDNKGLISYS